MKANEMGDRATQRGTAGREANQRAGHEMRANEMRQSARALGRKYFVSGWEHREWEAKEGSEQIRAQCEHHSVGGGTPLGQRQWTGMLANGKR